jgi:LacI family transcriptional regulator
VSAVTLRDVARLADVHPGTASRALNPETRGLVNGDTAQRVLAVAEELGYRPNPIARGLKTNRSYTIGVLIPDITNPLFPPVVRGIEDGLEDAGYTSLIANTDNDPERERVDMKAMRARQVDGFITATARHDHSVLEEIRDSGVPVVLVNRTVEDASLPAVVGDDQAGITLAVRHLAELGHRRIAHLAGAQDVSTGRRRYEGFLVAMRSAGLKVHDELIVFGDAFTEPEGARVCADLLDRDAGVTAIVAANDLMALGCCDVFSERGIDCPEHVSIVGYNDMPLVDRFSPPLTTIRIPHYEVGVRAAELLLEALRTPDAEPRQLLLEPELVVRGSSAPPHGS